MSITPAYLGRYEAEDEKKREVLRRAFLSFNHLWPRQDVSLKKHAWEVIGIIEKQWDDIDAETIRQRLLILHKRLKGEI